MADARRPRFPCFACTAPSPLASRGTGLSDARAWHSAHTLHMGSDGLPRGQTPLTRLVKGAGELRAVLRAGIAAGAHRRAQGRGSGGPRVPLRKRRTSSIRTAAAATPSSRSTSTSSPCAHTTRCRRRRPRCPASARYAARPLPTPSPCPRRTRLRHPARPQATPTSGAG